MILGPSRYLLQILPLIGCTVIPSQVLYVREAITRYNKLFGGRMEKLAQALGDLPTNPVPRNVVKKLRAIIDADKSLQ
jgi:hypothetical protein